MRKFELSVFLLFLSVFFVSCSLPGRKEKKSEPVTVRVISVETTSNAGTSSYIGAVRTLKKAVVEAPSSGTLADLNFSVGQRVTKGQALARIESQTVRSAYEISKATFLQAKDGMKRLQTVYKKGGIPEVKMVEMRANLSKAEAAFKASQKSLDDCTVKSPFDGTVESVSVCAGEELVIGQPIMSIVDPDEFEIHFPLPEKEFSRIPCGTPVRVVVPAIDKSLRARIAVKGVVASPLSHSYDCILDSLSDSSGIMPGMVCKVYVLTPASPGKVIPSTAVMTDMKGRYVWTVSDGIVSKNYITVGGYSGDGIFVTDGIPEGASVVIEGTRKISTGMAVKTLE